ncbi:cerebellin 18 [Centroberyx affinis]|uniref:cerebellin 18 n=1 Tax=Centroberyx affinis TaxID=166261 RepID=UPI003A5C44F0
MKLVALSVVSLWAALCLCASVEALSTYEIMKHAALTYKGPLPCGDWDCDCAFNRQRGCCCVATQMYQLEEATFVRLVKLWQRLETLQTGVKAITENSQIVFRATMVPSAGCFGPFTTNVPIAYGNIGINEGNGYNAALGIFTAPRCGLYVFSFTAYSNVGEPAERLYHKVQMMNDGAVVVSMWEDNREDSEDSGTQVVLVHMRRGSQVYMELVSGRHLCGRKEYNRFSGFLLYPSEEE